MSFQTEYKKLNSAQKEAVDYIEGPLLVVAGPGTGKTQLLSMRVANILQKTDIDANNIICLTFTNKAATNMRERLQELIGSSARNVSVKTFHSFAAEIMNQYPDYFWNGARLSVAPDAVQTEIIQNILAALPLKNPLSSTFAGTYTALSGVKQALMLAKEAGITPSQLRSIIKQNLEYIDHIEPIMVDLLSPTLSVKTLETLQSAIAKLPPQNVENDTLLLQLDKLLQQSLEFAVNQDKLTGKTKQTGKWKLRWIQSVEGKKGMFAERKRNEWWLAVADVYELYRQHLHENGYYDYSDMLIEVLEQLEKAPDMLADIQERYLYVLIDEFQDTNAAQLRLAHLVSDHYSSNNQPNLMAVGDDDQSIFAFNGAELSNMLSFRRRYPTTKFVLLTDNYRSSQAILDVASQIIDQADDRLVKRDSTIHKELTAKQPPKGNTNIQHLNYPTRQHQYSMLADDIEKLWKNGEHNIAILARKHDSLRQLSAILLYRKLPINYDQQSNVLENEAVSYILLLAKTVVCIATGDKAAVNVGLSELLRHPMWNLSPKTLWKLAVANYSAPDWLSTMLDNDDPSIQAIANWLIWLVRASNNQPLPLIMEYILGLQKGEYLLSPFREYYLESSHLNSQYLETVSAVEILRGLTAEFTGKATTLADFVRFIELNLSAKRVIADESWFMSGEEAIQLLTIHKAKGLEFEHVFVVDMIEEMWKPRAGTHKSPANLELQSYGENDDDYVRLLYVAASRAKRTLQLSSYFTDQNGNQLLPTPLIAILPQTIVDAPNDKPIEILEENLRWPILSTKDEKNLLKDRLDTYSLSSTAFIDFLNIAEAGPSSFKERHLLHLPRPRSAQGSYGTAVHAALETAQRLVNTSKLITRTVLDRFETALLDEHMAPLDYEHYLVQGTELLENLLSKESTFTFVKGSLSEQQIRDITLGHARINGKLDLIELSNEQTLISDYKTGKALSSFDTKDKTKQVKAWRHKTQLLFYCLLVNNCSRFNGHPRAKAQMIYVEAQKASQLKLGLEPSTEELKRLELLIEVVWQHIIALQFPDTKSYNTDILGIKKFEDDLLKGTI